jgi:hypothetical protein
LQNLLFKCGSFKEYCSLVIIFPGTQFGEWLSSRVFAAYMKNIVGVVYGGGKVDMAGSM